MIKILFSLLLYTIFISAKPQFILHLSKTEAYTGEILTATLILRYDPQDPPTGIHFTGLHTVKFEIIKDMHPSKVHIGEKRYQYFLIPKSPGTYPLPSQTIEIAYKDPKTYRKTWQTLQSSKIHMQIHTPPKGITLLGEYTLSAQNDMNTTETNKPVNLTVVIEGKGDLRSLQPLTLPLKDALVFSTDPVVETNTTDGIYHSRYTQSFSILSDESFTIPTLTRRYLNTKTGLIEILSTTPKPITVQGSSMKQAYFQNLILLFSGIFLGVLSVWIGHKVRSRRRYIPATLRQKVARCKTDQARYALLLAYADCPQAIALLRKLEANLYQGTSYRIKTKVLTKVLYQCSKKH